MREIIIQAVRLFIMIAVFLFTRYAIPWFQAQTNNAVMSGVIDWAVQAVLAAEQVHASQTGPERKYIVTQFLRKILEQKNIALSDDELDTIIEAAVMEMNMTIKAPAEATANKEEDVDELLDE